MTIGAVRTLAAGGTVAAVLAAALTAPAWAVDHKRKSQITSLELSACKILKRHPDGNSYSCTGLNGIPVYLAEGDLRTYLSFGTNPSKRRAAEQTLGPFNTLFEVGGKRTTIEWRVSDRGGKPQPYATIVRYYVSRDKARSEALVVTRLDSNDACHVAYIDAKSNADAMAIARRVADEDAPGFDCKKEPAVIGVPGLLGP